MSRKLSKETIELIRTEDNKVFQSTDDLEYDKDGADVLGSIANDIVTGIRLGENLNPS